MFDDERGTVDKRLAIYELAAAHGLDAASTRRLVQLAYPDDEPAALRSLLGRGMAVLAAALGGLGVVFWVAANWDDLGRSGRFALLEGCLVLAGAAALTGTRARVPAALLALLAIGALFAYFGQTYQTGADAWQLFALWALLALPLGLGARSDAVWAPWALVAMCAVSLWVQARTGHRWRVDPGDLPAHMVGWAAAAALVALMAAPMRRYTGAGPWALRCAITLAAAMVTFSALGGLFQKDVGPHYYAGLAMLAAGAAALAAARPVELYGLSAVALGFDTLVVAGLGRWLFQGERLDSIPSLTLLGVAAAGLLAATVTAVMRWARHRGATEGEAPGAPPGGSGAVAPREAASSRERPFVDRGEQNP